MGLTYRDSGVDIDKGEEFVRIVKSKLKKDESESIGLFGALYDIGSLNYKNPVLVSSTDGVGTKLLLAKLANSYSTIGIDLVAMCVNDIITLGAKPLFFLDYMATAELDLNKASQIIDGIIEGCRQSDCKLIGGETAEMPGVYKKDDYELAGFTVGIVEKDHIIDGRDIKFGDVIIGLPSSGIHSNGLSLARKSLFEVKGYRYDEVLKELGNRRLIDELLTPTRIYVKQVLAIIEKFRLKGIAHITGGGLYGNIIRLIPENADVKIDWNSIKPHEIFKVIQNAGNISDDEMRKTFNMGIGLAIIVERDITNNVLKYIKDELKEDALIIGEVVDKK